MADKTKGHEANVKFAKLQRAQTAQRVTSDYEATAAALRAKTERLKALRLERDAAAPKPAPAGRTGKARKGAAAAACRTFWTDKRRKAATGDATL